MKFYVDQFGKVRACLNDLAFEAGVKAFSDELVILKSSACPEDVSDLANTRHEQYLKAMGTIMGFLESQRIGMTIVEFIVNYIYYRIGWSLPADVKQAADYISLPNNTITIDADLRPPENTDC